MIKNRYIKVSFRREGVHMFPGADTNPKYATGGWDDVSFLGYPHRHKFYFYVNTFIDKIILIFNKILE